MLWTNRIKEPIQGIVYHKFENSVTVMLRVLVHVFVVCLIVSWTSSFAMDGGSLVDCLFSDDVFHNKCFPRCKYIYTPVSVPKHTHVLRMSTRRHCLHISTKQHSFTYCVPILQKKLIALIKMDRKSNKPPELGSFIYIRGWGWS